MLTSWRAAIWLGLAAQSVEGENWAVLVAGSSGWFNYRHQVRAASPVPAEILLYVLGDFVDVLPVTSLGCEPRRAPSSWCCRTIYFLVREPFGLKYACSSRTCWCPTSTWSDVADLLWFFFGMSCTRAVWMLRGSFCTPRTKLCSLECSRSSSREPWCNAGNFLMGLVSGVVSEQATLASGEKKKAIVRTSGLVCHCSRPREPRTSCGELQVADEP